mmetsp:Transcript_5578/g.7256  ORF Transcript_5578/g.7256 Transcript_5578/m.7256 type:complete len:460 (+) Transcript_5578:31-1410(+)
MASLKRKIEDEEEEDRFLKAQNRTFNGLTKDKEKTWKGKFSFVVMADTQLGMLKQDKSWDEESEFLRKAIHHINKIRPRFVVVCGDLVNAYPHKPKEQEDQVKDFKILTSEINDDIPLVCVCGNHDVGDRPTRATIDLYKERFGDDYFTYWVGGVRFIALNTQLHKDSSGAPEEARIQDEWLEEEVEKQINEVNEKKLQKQNQKRISNTKSKKTNKNMETVSEVSDQSLSGVELNGGIRTIALSHIPPFIDDSNEDNGYFNIDYPIRRKLLNTLRRGNCTHWFCGHYHRNAGGIDRGEVIKTTSSSSTPVVEVEVAASSSSEAVVTSDKVQVLKVETVENASKDDKEGMNLSSPQTTTMGKEAPLEVIVSSAIGCTLLPNGQDPLGLKGFLIPPVLREDLSGLRVATIEKNKVSHEWFTLEDLNKHVSINSETKQQEKHKTSTDEPTPKRRSARRRTIE